MKTAAAADFLPALLRDTQASNIEEFKLLMDALDQYVCGMQEPVAEADEFGETNPLKVKLEMAEAMLDRMQDAFVSALGAKAAPVLASQSGVPL